MRWTRRADSHYAAGADFKHRPTVRIRISRIVGAHDGIAAAQKRHSGGHPEAEPFERRQARLGTPVALVRADGINDPACPAPGLEVAAPHGLDQAMPCVAVRVDQPRHDELAASVDHFIRAMPGFDFGSRTDCDDAVFLDRDRSVLDNAPLGVHRYHDPVRYENVSHR